MVLTEKVLKEVLAKKFELNAKEVATVRFRFGCTVFDKDIASFAEDEAYYLWSGSLIKRNKKYYFACRIDGLPEVIEPDCCSVSNVDNFIARNCNMYTLSNNASGQYVLSPCWYWDIAKVQEKARFKPELGEIVGKFEYISSHGQIFFAWTFYSQSKVLLKAFNIEEGVWVMPSEVFSHKVLCEYPLCEDVLTSYGRASIDALI